MIHSPADQSTWDNYPTYTEIEGHLMVTFSTINKMVNMEKTDNEIEYIKTNTLHLEETLTIWVKPEDNDNERIIIDIFVSSGGDISANELDEIEEAEQVEGKDELLRMQENQEDSKCGIMPIMNNKPGRNSLCQTCIQEDLDF